MKKKLVNPVIKDSITFIQTSDETNTSITELELTLMPKGGNFPHYHTAFTETFTAMDGTLGLQLPGEKTKILQPGQVYSVPPNQVHRFFNPGPTEIKFNIKITPGHKGFENALRILYGLAEDGLTDKKSIPKNLSHVAIIGNLSDSRLLGFMKLLSPLFNLLAKRARKNGLEEKLIARYCN